MSAKSNPLLYTSQKLSGEWSAANFANNLDVEMADKLMDEWAKLDTGVRMRLLLSTLFMKEEQRDAIRQQMQQLIDNAIGSGEEDDWVKVIAHAVRQLDGQLDLAAVATSSKDVEAGIAALTAQMKSLQPVGYQPLETPYLNTRLVSDATVELAMQQRQQLPFTLRPGADDALQASCATPEGAGTGTHEDSPGPPTVGGVRGVRGHIHTQANEGMFRSASKPLPSRRSSALVPGIQERRSKVVTLPTDLALQKLNQEAPARQAPRGGKRKEPPTVAQCDDRVAQEAVPDDGDQQQQ